MDKNEIDCSSDNGRRSAESYFLTASDKELDLFFKVLDSLASPDKEAFFVRFCLENRP